jgi:hypothetical protein
MKRTGPTNPERAFGVSIGTVLLILAAWSLWRGRVQSGAAFASAGTVLLILGLAWPTLIKWPSAIWWRFSLARERATFPGWSPPPARYRDRAHYSRMY